MQRLKRLKIDRNDCAIAFALIALAYGLWPSLGRGALVIPSLIVLWLSIPQREPLVKQPTPKVVRRQLLDTDEERE
jgi:hypothetical protein